MTGDEATRELRARGCTVPIVGVTGDAHDTDLDGFVRAGLNEVVRCELEGDDERLCAQVLTKPVPLKLLIDTVRRMLMLPSPNASQEALNASQEAGSGGHDSEVRLTLGIG